MTDKILDLLQVLSKLKGKSRIEKLQGLAQVAGALATASEATDDPDVERLIDQVALAAGAIAAGIQQKTQA